MLCYLNNYFISHQTIKIYSVLANMYIMFSAKNDQEELFDAILEQEVTFPSPYWDEVSEVARVGSFIDVLVHNSCMILRKSVFIIYF